MVDFSEDLINNSFYEEDDTEFDNIKIMCTNCGEIVFENQTLFENGDSCCVYCSD